MIVYYAIERDTDLTTDQVLCISDDLEVLKKEVKEYFGVESDKHYGKPAQYLGFIEHTDISGHYNPCIGQMKFIDKGYTHIIRIYEQELVIKNSKKFLN